MVQSPHDKVIQRLCKHSDINLVYEIDYSARGLVQAKGLLDLQKNGPAFITLRLASLRTPLSLLGGQHEMGGPLAS